MKIEGTDASGVRREPFLVAPRRARELPDVGAACDTVSISREARQKAKEVRRQLEEMHSDIQRMKEELESAKAQGDAAGEAIRTRMKCLVIAMRIMHGDEVPKQDYQFLAKNDRELYMKAVSMRMAKENPQKHKRITRDEKPQGADADDRPPRAGEATEAGEAGEAPAEN